MPLKESLAACSRIALPINCPDHSRPTDEALPSNDQKAAGSAATDLPEKTSASAKKRAAFIIFKGSYLIRRNDARRFPTSNSEIDCVVIAHSP